MKATHSMVGSGERNNGGVLVGDDAAEAVAAGVVTGGVEDTYSEDRATEDQRSHRGPSASPGMFRLFSIPLLLYVLITVDFTVKILWPLPSPVSTFANCQ